MDLRAQAVSGEAPNQNEKYGENMERQKSRASPRTNPQKVEADPDDYDVSQVQELAQLVKDSDEEDEESVDPLDDFGGGTFGQIAIDHRRFVTL